MRNKIITFGSATPSQSSINSNERQDEVYVDLNLISKPNEKTDEFKIDSNINVRAVQGSLHNIFTWIPGERILLPEFGSKIRKLLYEGITEYNTEQIISEIKKSISEWEPRVQVQNIINVGNIDDKEDNVVHLEIIYTIPGLSEKQFNYGLYSYTQSY